MEAFKAYFIIWLIVTLFMMWYYRDTNYKASIISSFIWSQLVLISWAVVINTLHWIGGKL